MTTTLLVLVAIFFLLLLAVPGVVIFMFARRAKLRKSVERVATAMGWQVVRAGHGYTEWFQGSAHGRQAAIRLLKQIDSIARAGASPAGRVRTRDVWRVVMEVAVQRPLGVDAEHTPVLADGSATVSFQTAGAVGVPVAAQAAMLRFAQTPAHANGAGQNLGTPPMTRHLRLADRSVVGPHDMAVQVLPHARTVLIHDFRLSPPRLGDDSARLPQTLNELAHVAYAIEQASR